MREKTMYYRQDIALIVRERTGGDIMNVIVPAYSQGVLAIHKDLDNPNAYTVSHLNSGLAILDGLSLHNAHRLIKQALSLDIDWTQDGDAIAALPKDYRYSIGRALKAAIEEEGRQE
jgi:hypothetical protein